MMTLTSILESFLEPSLRTYRFLVAPMAEIVDKFGVTFQTRKMSRRASVRGGRGAQVGGRGGASGGREASPPSYARIRITCPARPATS